MNIITYIKKHIVSGYTLSALLLLCVLFVFTATVHADEDQFIVRQIVGGDTTPPTTPTSLVATAISTTQIDLSWTGSTDNSLTVAGYQVFRDMVFVATTTLTSYSDIDLTPSTTYAYTVTAFDNSVNISEHSATSSATTLPVPTVDVADTTITDDGGGRAGPTTQVEYFSISPDVYSAWIQIGTNVPVKTITKWGITADYELGSVAGPVYLTDHVIQLDGLLPNTHYVVRVEITDAHGRMLVIDNQEFTTRSLPDIFPPENISDFRATPDTNRIVLTWKNPKVDFASVRIVRSDKFFPRDPMEGEVVYEGTGERYVDTDVVPNQPYYYAAFVRDPMGNYSSGALAGARLLNPGESPFVQDLFAGIVQLPRSSVDPLLQNFVVGDIRFMQDGAELAAADSKVTLRGDLDFVVAIDYDKMPEVLKTIVVTLHDPVDSSKTFSFLLRVNKEKTAYEAHVAPLGRAGEYAFTVSILDHKKQGLVSVMGSIIATMPDIFSSGRSTWFDYVKQNPIISFSLIALLMILFGMFYKIHRHKAALAATKTLSGALVVLLMLTMFAPSSAHAAFNKEINYQGKLTNTSNVSVSDGTYHMRFKLYTVPTGGTEVWSEDRSTAVGDRITISNGLFSVMLGSSTPLSTVDFNQTLYLGVEIGGSAGAASWDGEMTPRKKIGAVPAAVETDRIDGLSSEQFLRSDTSNSTSTATTFLSFVQNGVGKIAEFIGQGAAAVFNVGSNGVVNVGTTTGYARFNVWGAGTGTGILANFVNNASTSVMTILDNGNVGIATTSPYAPLSVYGQAVASYFTATSTTQASTFPYASTTALTVSGTGGLQLATGLNGPLQVNAGLVSATTSIGVVYGGTGLTSAPSYGHMLLGNSSGGYTLTATSSLGITSSQWTTSGSNIFYNSGNVSVGTSSAYARFNVWGAGTGTGILANFANNASTSVMTLLDNGNIGIGTSSPYARLSVAGTAVVGNIVATSTATSTIASELWISGASVNDVIGSAPVTQGRKVLPIFDLAKTERVAWVGIGDSNQLKDGYGWDAGIAKALESRFGLWGSGFYQFFADFNETGTWGAPGYHTSPYTNTNVDSTGAPAGLDAKMTATPATPRYTYLASGTTNPLGFSYDGITLNHKLRFHYTYGTHSSWSAGQFAPTIRRSGFPYTVYASGGTISSVGTDNALVDGYLDLPENSATTSVEFLLHSSGGSVTGPVFFTMGAVEDLGVNNGFSYQTLGAYGGVSARVMLSEMQTFGTTGLTEYFRHVRRLLGTNKAVIVNINEGLNDRSDTGSSLGPIGGLDSSTPDGFRDNVQGIINLVRSTYALNGWNQNYLYFLISPSHPISDPDDTQLISYRNAAGYMATRPNATNTAAYWFDRDVTYTELDGNNYYYSEGDKSHMVSSGYDYLGDKLVRTVSGYNDSNLNLADISSQSGSVGSSSPFAKFSIHAGVNDNFETLFAVGSSTASATTTLFSINRSGVVSINGNFGVGTTSPYAKFSVAGQAVAAYFTATSTTASTLPYASTTALTVSGSAYFAGNGVWNSTGLGIGTTSPTHAITLPSLSTGMAFYNTSDQTTNYERFVGSWSGNVFTIKPEAGGSGTVRNFVVGQAVNGASLTLNGGYANITLSNTAPHIAFARDLTNSVSLASFASNLSNTSGTIQYVSIKPTYNQSGSTAANTDFLINRTENNVGSGAQYLFDAQVGSVTRFNVTNTGNVGVGTSSPYAKLSVAGQVVAGYFTATSTTASTFPYASTTALSVSGTAHFPSSGIWNSSGQIGIGTTTPNSIDKIAIRNSGIGGASVYGDIGGISFSNSDARSSSDFTMNFGMVPYPNGAAQTFHDSYYSECYRGKAGTNANMTGVTGCRMREFPWYDTVTGHYVMEDYIRIDNTNAGQVIDNYRPIMSNFDIDTANPRSRFIFNAIDSFSVNDNLTSSNVGGASFNNDHNMLWLNSVTSQGQINLKSFSFGNQTNLSTTKLAVVATSTETDLADIFTVASTSVGGSVTKYFWVPRTGGIGLSQLTPASTPNGVLYNDSSGNLTWNGGSSITGATVINTGNAGLTLALSVKRTAQFDSGVSSQSAITAFGRASQSVDIVNVRDVGAGNVLFNVGISPDYKVGVGTTTPWAKFSVNASGLTSGVPQFVVGSSTATHLIVANGGNVGVGTTSPWKKFSVTGNVAMSGLSTNTGNDVCIDSTTKEITDAGATSCTPSSIRFKENVETLGEGFALDKLNQLRVVSFDYKKGFYSPEDHPESYGLIAEEVEEIDPYLVDYGYDGLPQTLQFEKILGLTVQAVQELSQGGRMAGISAAGVIDVLNSLGLQIVDGIAYIKGLFVESLTVGSSEKPTGITIYDEVTGEPYCLKVASGKMKNVPGECTKEEDDTNDNGGGITPVEPGEINQTEIAPVDEGGDPVILPVDEGGGITPSDQGVDVDTGKEGDTTGDDVGEDTGDSDTPTDTPTEAPEDTGGDDAAPVE